MKSSNGSIPRRSNLSTQAQKDAATESERLRSLADDAAEKAAAAEAATGRAEAEAAKQARLASNFCGLVSVIVFKNSFD